ncbi:MAG: hypothetical protein WCO33_01830 [bacterium]
MNKYLEQKESFNKIKDIVHSTQQRARNLFTLRRKVKGSLRIKDFHFSISNVLSGNSEINEVIHKEKGVNKVFLLPFKVKSYEYYSFIRTLQNIGFDIYTLFSIPKGDILSITHGSIPKLKQVLQSNQIPSLRHPGITNMLIKRDLFKEGQLHSRFYEGKGITLMTAHIDPPDIKDHLSPHNQLSGLTKADYPLGEELIEKTLELIQKNYGNHLK